MAAEGGIAAERVRGTDIRGRLAQRLMLSDGSRLVLDTNKEGHRGGVGWHRFGGGPGAAAGAVSVRQAMRIAGPEFTGFVRLRTQIEVGWMLALSRWYREQSEPEWQMHADRLRAEAESLVAGLPEA
jgi:hypothetical protein